VTDPLRTALRTDRVNHAYLFSGPRGCGKTTSARILARCLNCVEGPTDTPCGVCPSCVELSREGGGSMDVVEIDAASHGGVDDARDLRERAIFAPARDRYKIFILDEAHMVTTTGFNALLKIVEEPPEHVKFIFATTEPEKVIGTIRSRTHHYPFRLVPPAQMLEYVQHLCEEESITVAPGVLPLVVRAGGGSVRDTLSLLDQLMAGSEGTNVEYERAVALLGYTHGALLDEVVDSVGARDAAAAFAAIDRIIQTGQDPRRFVEDLLERLRDLIIVAATGDGAAAVLRGIPQDELERMAQQSHKFGSAELSRAADVVNAALTEMTGATSPRLHLELMVARILVPASDESERGSLARLERLERRIGIEGSDAAGAVEAPARPAIAEGSPRASATGSAYPERAVRPPLTPPRAEPASTLGRRREPVRPPAAPVEQTPAAPVTPAAATSSWPVTVVPGSKGAPAPAAEVAKAPVSAPGAAPAEGAEAKAAASDALAAATPAAVPTGDTPEAKAPSANVPATTPAAPATTPPPAAASTTAASTTTASTTTAPTTTAPTTAAPAPAAAASTTAAGTAAPSGAPAPVTLQQMRDSWPEILELVKRDKRSAWIVVFSSQARALAGDVLTLTFPNDNDVADFRQPPVDGEGVSEYLRRAILDVLGIRVKFIARVEPTMASTAASARAAAASPQATTPQARPAQSAPAQPAAARTAPAQTAPARTAPAQSAPAQSRPQQAPPGQGRPPQGGARAGDQARPQQQTQQARPPQGRGPQQGGSPQQGQSRPPQNRKLSDLPDSAAPPPDDYVEPIEPDLQSEYEPGGWAVASIPGGPTPSPQQNEEVAAAKAAAKPNLVIDPTAPPVRPFGKGTPPPVLAPGEKQRYGESVVREILGASFIEEEPVAPRVIPMPRND
jgi:DNA polymerase-3 subunit gamma/tau